MELLLAWEERYEVDQGQCFEQFPGAQPNPTTLYLLLLRL